MKFMKFTKYTPYLIMLLALSMPALLAAQTEGKAIKTVARTTSITANPATEPEGQEVKILRFDQIEARLKDPKSKNLKVVNFWATWCRPCVKELPHFEQLRGEYANKGVEVVLVSVDFPEEFKTRVQDFIREREIESEVLCMNETNANGFIDRINPGWSGAIPATLLVAPGGEYVGFHAGEFSYEELEAFIAPHLPK